jgi:hypothetical protein
MMVTLGPESARDGRLIRQLYKPHLDLLVLDNYDELELAHWNGGVAALPDPSRFNLAPRVDGHSPIGEKDLPNQVSYVAARPAMIGVLLDIAARVTSGPLEVTSLVRHTEYQGALRTTNVNANTAVPMHTMGLAVDIALVNTPLETVYEIRDVLREMRKSGDILFVSSSSTWCRTRRGSDTTRTCTRRRSACPRRTASRRSWRSRPPARPRARPAGRP